MAKDTVPTGTQIVLFGSQARGDARQDSDWDILILVDKEERITNSDFDRIAYPFVELGWSLEQTSIRFFTPRASGRSATSHRSIKMSPRMASSYGIRNAEHAQFRRL